MADDGADDGAMMVEGGRFHGGKYTRWGTVCLDISCENGQAWVSGQVEPRFARELRRRHSPIGSFT
jgi:hypothetical protein